jgi:hypothetical protein
VDVVEELHPVAQLAAKELEECGEADELFLGVEVFPDVIEGLTGVE